MTKFIRQQEAFASEDSAFIYQASYANTSPCQHIRQMTISILKDETFSLRFNARTQQQVEVILKALDGLVACKPISACNCHMEFNAVKELASRIFQAIHEVEPLDDFILKELQQHLAISFEWCDASLVAQLEEADTEKVIDELDQNEPKQLFKLGQLIEQRLQDMCDFSVETLLLAMQCYEKVPADDPNFQKANEQICTLVTAVLTTKQAQDLTQQLLIEHINALFKLNRHAEAKVLLEQAHGVSPKP